MTHNVLVHIYITLFCLAGYVQKVHIYTFSFSKWWNGGSHTLEKALKIKACHRFTHLILLPFLHTDSPARPPVRGGPCVRQHAGHSSHLEPADGRLHCSPSPETPRHAGAPPDKPGKGAWLRSASDGPHNCRGIVGKWLRGRLQIQCHYWLVINSMWGGDQVYHKETVIYTVERLWRFYE